MGFAPGEAQFMQKCMAEMQNTVVVI